MGHSSHYSHQGNLAPLQHQSGGDSHRSPYQEVPRSGGSRSVHSNDESTLGHRERLIAFYRKHNPAMLDKTDAILAKYRGHEEVLFHKLSRKYATSTADEGEQRSGWDNSVGNKKQRSVSDISGKNRASEVSNMQKQSL